VTSVQPLADLPQAVTNNAVALLPQGEDYRLVTALGLGAGRTWQDSSSDTFQFVASRASWQRLEQVPGGQGRLAAAAVAVAGKVYLFGGYTVAQDGTEQSTPEVYGIGYDGKPSEPLADVLSYDVRAGRWQCHGQLAVASMDHRGLPWHAGWFYVIGGMRTGRQVSSGVFRFQPPPAGPC
jgi:hypothetical protein